MTEPGAPDRPVPPGAARRGALLAAAIVAFTAATATMNWIKYASLRSTWAYDLGYYHNAAFNHARGRDISYLLVSAWFERGEHNGPSIYRSTHFAPLRLLLWELYRFWPDIITMMILQSLVLGSGAAALYAFGTRRTGDPRAGALLAATVLLHPVILHLGFNDYRDIVLGIGPALWALSFHANRRMAPFVAAALVMLAARAEYAFLLALFGVLNARFVLAGRPRWRWVIVPVLLAGLWGLVCEAYYVYAYGTAWPAVVRAAGHAADGAAPMARLFARLPIFFRTMLAPACLGLMTPEAFVVALPFVAEAKSTAWPAFPHHHLQLLSPATVVVLWAFACTVVRYWPRIAATPARRTLATAALAGVAAVGFVHFAAGALAAYPVARIARSAAIGRLADSLPEDATIVVPKSLAARFSRHMRVLVYESLPLGARPESRGELMASLAEVFAVADLVITKGEPPIDAVAARTGRFEPARRLRRYRAFVARADAPRPDDPDRALQRALRWDRLSARKRLWATILASGPPR